MRHRNVLSVIIVSLVLLASAVAMPVAASEHTVELQDGNQYWYGQQLQYNDAAVVSGEDWTLRGASSTNSVTVTAGQDGSITFDPTNLATDPANLQAEQVELVNPSGTVVLTANVDFQTLSPQAFSTDPVDNSGIDTTTSLEVQTNRTNSSYDLIVTEVDGKLTSSQLANISPEISEVNGNAEVASVTGNTTITFDFDGVAADSYNFEVSTQHAREVESGSLTPVSGTQSVTVEEAATGSVAGGVSTEDSDYSGNIDLTLVNQNNSLEITKTVSGPQSDYTFNDVNTGTYNLTLNAQNHQSQTISNIEVTENSTTNVPDTTLQVQDTIISTTINVDPVDGDAYDRPLTATLIDPNGDVVEETDVNDGGTVDFAVSSTGTYTIQVDDRFVEQASETVNVDALGQSYTVELQPVEQDRGALEVDASAEGDVEEIRVIADSTSEDRVRIFTIDGSQGTIERDLLTGEYDITVEAIGNESQTQTVTISSGSLQTVSVNLTGDTLNPVDGGQYWVGQSIDFSQYVSEGDSVRFRNRDSGEVYNPAVSNPDDFVVMTENIQSNAGTGDIVFEVNGTVEVEFALSEQSLSTSFTSPVQLGGDLESSFTVSSERSSEQTVVITEIVAPDGTQINGSQAAELNNQWGTSGTKAYTTVTTSEAFFTFDMSQAPFDLQEGEYTFNTEVVDTGASSETTLTVEPESNTSIENIVSDETIENNGLYWTGQVISLPSDEVSQSETYRILKDETLVEELAPRNSDGKLIFDTSWESYGSGDYTIEDSEGNVVVGQFLVRDQEFSAEFNSNTVLNTGAQTEANVSFDSNRSTYPLIVELNEGPTDLSVTEIANRVESADIQEVRIDGEMVPKAVIASAGSGEERIDFEDLSEGTYTFEFNVVDSTASETASIDVSGLQEGTPQFSKRIYEDRQGNVAEFDIVMASGVDESTLVIGNNDVGYVAELRLTNPTPNNSTIVTVQMDTTHAGQGQPDKTFSIISQESTQDEESEDGEEENTSSGAQVQMDVISETEIGAEGMIAPTRYLLQLEMDDKERDISAFELKPLSAEMEGLYIIPQTTTIDELQSSSDEESEESDESEDSEDGEDNVEQASQPFFGDSESPADGEMPEPETGVVAVKLNGLGSQLYQDGLNASDFEPGSATVADTGAYVDIEQISDSERNRSAEDIPTSSLDYRFNQESGHIYFLIQPSLIEEAKIGQTYEFEFVIDERNSAITEGEREPITVTKEFTITESAVNWGMDPIQVEPTSEQPITAQTVYTPGAEMRMVLLSYDTSFPYFYSSDLEVQEDGRVIGSYDLNGAPVGTEFQVILRNLQEPQDALVVENAQKPDFARTIEPEEVNLTINLEDPDGNAINGNINVNGQTRSGSSAEFTVETETDVTVEGSASDYNSSSRTVSVGTSDQETTIVLEPTQTETPVPTPTPEPETTYDISVTVIDEETEEPIEGATVSFGTISAETGSEGTISMSIPEGVYTASITAEGYSELTQDVSISSDESYELSLEQEDDSSGDGTTTATTDNSTATTDTGQTPQTDDSVRTEGQNGFGILVALIAVGSVLIARRLRK